MLPVTVAVGVAVAVMVEVTLNNQWRPSSICVSIVIFAVAIPRSLWQWTEIIASSILETLSFKYLILV